MRLLLIFILLAAVVLLTFFLWGETLVNVFSHQGTITWLAQYGNWAWLVAVILLMGDLILPLPATLVMSALGYIYGPVVGGLLSVAGSFMAGSSGYWLCRLLGNKTAIRLLGKHDYERGKKLSGDVGGWIVVISRWLPVFPEVISCMAGLTRMPALYFHGALFCGALPLGFVFAFVGYAGVEHPTVAILLSALMPPLIWLWVRPVFTSKLNKSDQGS